jgi:hypothetical protein
MPKKKIILLLSIIPILGAVLIFSMRNAGATTQQAESLQIKHQLEQQDNEILKEKDAAAAKVRNNLKTKSENVRSLPADEPEQYKKPYQWNRDGYTQRHNLKTADSVWTAYGIIEPNNVVWDEFVVWCGLNEDGKQVIGTFLDPDGFNGKYNAVYVCPNQNIGKISITNIKGNVIYFVADNGSKGTFDLNADKWDIGK